MIAEAASRLPPTKEHARYLWQLVTRIDKKLANGVDDSDGVVGECVMGIIEQLIGYSKQNPELAPAIRKFCETDTHFGFERELRAGLE
ncbi:hypothetical protein Tel_09105 [Candidatus Tenderia electrophaga]|jgi:hypothetical protein|uniref:Uncharacterized protein n=1 Tax=Candidatus Tenderia electrophaga TaxID=1748243 RepID=A0A0S2TDU3_9GAMM|nr:hypothetical protein Tel_09105 [Candidatus Tenderia electrophaga]